MAFPIAAAISGGAGIASSIMGAQAQRDAAALEAQVAMYNLAEQQRQHRANNALANRSLDATLAPQQLADGSWVRYIPGRGWVYDMSPETQALQSAERGEMMARLTEDAQRTRRGERTNEARRGEEASMADILLNELRRPDKYSQDYVQGGIRQANRAGVNEAFDRDTNRVMTQALRAGTPAAATAKTAGDLASRRGEALSRADADAFMQSLGLTDTLNRNAKNDTLNKYNLFATRASNIPGAQFTPFGDDDALTSAVMSARNTAPQGFGVAGNISNAIIPQLNYRPTPQYGDALAVGGIGNLLGSFFEGSRPYNNAPNTAKDPSKRF